MLCAPLPVASQAVVEGFVRERDGAGIDQATVTFSKTAGTPAERSTPTDRFGFFRMRLDTGEYVVRAVRIGFAESTRTISLRSNAVLRLEFVLEERALEIGAVTVAGERGRTNFNDNAGQTTRELSQAELKLIPGLAEADVMRAIEVLPGVVTTSDFSSAFNVRGGSADQNLIALDGLPVYNPFHLGGLFSVFNSDMVGRAELIAGGFPAQYGGRVSSVLNVESDPGPPGVDVRGGISLLATRVAVSADAPTSFANKLGLRSMRGRIAGRRSYFDQLFKPFFDFPYHLTDIQAYAEGWTRGGGRLSFTGYTGKDLLNFTGVDSFPLRVRWDWGNHLAGMRWLQHTSSGGVIDARAGFTQFSTAILFPEFGDTRFTSRIRQGFGKLDVQLPANSRIEFKVGGEANALRYANRAESGGTVFRQGRETGWMLGGYSQANWRPQNEWLIEVGARVDAWLASRNSVVVQPRIAAKRFVSSDAAIKLAVGRYAQFVHSLRDEELPIGIDVWVTAGQRAPRVASDQVQGGIELFRNGWYASVESYYRKFDGVATNNFADDPNTDADDLLGGQGNSYGLDVLIRRDQGSVKGFLSASWLRARRSFPDPVSGLVPQPEITYPPIFDRRLDADLVLSTTLPRNWEAGLRWNLGTGLPYTRATGSYLFYEYNLVNRGKRELSDEPDSANVAVLLGERNAERYPAYHRLDLSLRKPMQKSWGQITPYLQVLNVYNRKNVLFYFYDYNRTPAMRSGVSMFPLLPTVGVELVF